MMAFISLQCWQFSCSFLRSWMTRAPLAPDFNLKQRLVCTTWEPQRLESFPGLSRGTRIVGDMKFCFRGIPVPDEIWHNTARRLDVCRLASLQAFVAWRRCRGEPRLHLGSTPLHARDRTAIFAGLTGQRYAAASSGGLDHLLPPGLGPVQHVTEALRHPSPFCPVVWPEPGTPPGLAQIQRTILRSVALGKVPPAASHLPPSMAGYPAGQAPLDRLPYCWA